MISVACPWKPPDGTDPGSVADELKNRFEHAPLVDRISTRRFGHGDGICLLEIVLGIAPSCQCGAHETHKHVALPFVLQRRCGDVESIFKETEAASANRTWSRSLGASPARKIDQYSLYIITVAQAARFSMRSFASG